MPTWTEALDAIRQDIIDINALKDKRHAIKQTALVKASSNKDYIKPKKKKEGSAVQAGPNYNLHMAGAIRLSDKPSASQAPQAQHLSPAIP